MILFLNLFSSVGYGYEFKTVKLNNLPNALEIDLIHLCKFYYYYPKNKYSFVAKKLYNLITFVYKIVNT